MAMAHEFRYERPGTLKEALQLLGEHREKCRILAGGTDLIVNMKEGMVAPELVIDIKDIPDLKEISIHEHEIVIGAGITFADLIASDVFINGFPILHDAAKTVASTGVRSRATLAGNLASAVPSLDSAPALLVHDAYIEAASLQGTRMIPIQEFFLGPRKTALLPDEIILSIHLPFPDKKQGEVYLKLGRYGGEDLAQAGWGFVVDADRNYKIAHCALAATPKRALKIEQFLCGKELTPQVISHAKDIMREEIAPITDIRASKEYRLHVSGVMLERGLKAAFDRLQNREVHPQKLLGGIA